MLQFKDENIYEKSKYMIVLRYLGFSQEKHSVEIEYLHKDSCWHSNLPYEDELIDSERFGEDISFWSKYRKWQKRKRYTQDEFNRIFIDK